MKPTLPTASTRLSAIFGDPVRHSLSPAMHNACYEALGMDRAYVAFHVRAGELRDAINAIAALDLLGVNLTVPHKERAVRMVGSLSREAQILGAVNCVVNRPGGLFGDNTDARGLKIDLVESGARLAGRTAIVIGAGGAGRAATLACLRMGAARVVVANRTPARARRLAGALMAYRGAKNRIETRGLDALVEGALLGGTALVINATPMGLTTRRFAPLSYRQTPEDCLFYDLIYGEKPTAFLRPALRLGRRALDGAGMLVRQGELAFRLFNRVAPPPGVMRRALMASLGRRP